MVYIYIYIHPKIPVEGLMTPSQRVQKDWILLSLRSGAATLLMSTILRITAFPATQSGGYPLNHQLLSDSWKIPLKWMFSWKIIEHHRTIWGKFHGNLWNYQISWSTFRHRSQRCASQWWSSKSLKYERPQDHQQREKETHIWRATPWCGVARVGETTAIFRIEHEHEADKIWISNTNQASNQPTNQATKQATNQATDRLANEPTRQPGTYCSLNHKTILHLADFCQQIGWQTRFENLSPYEAWSSFIDYLDYHGLLWSIYAWQVDVQPLYNMLSLVLVHFRTIPVFSCDESMFVVAFCQRILLDSKKVPVLAMQNLPKISIAKRPLGGECGNDTSKTHLWDSGQTDFSASLCCAQLLLQSEVQSAPSQFNMLRTSSYELVKTSSNR